MAITNFPASGLTYKGSTVSYRYDIATDGFEFEYMGTKFLLDSINSTTQPIIMQTLDQIYHQKGVQNGVSRQAAQAVSSHSAPSQFGNIYGTGILSNAGHLQSQAVYNANRAAQLQHYQSVNFGAVESKSEPLKFDGVKLGEITGIRGWRIDGRFLRSMSADVIWAPGEVMEGKTKTKEGGDHGIYAFKTARDFLKELRGELHVYGKVALWGDIIEHELGYRAQFAKIISLDNWCGNAGEKTLGMSLDKLRKTYCPVAA